MPVQDGKTANLFFGVDLYRTRYIYYVNREMLSNSLVHGKPILLLCNKTDIDPSQVSTGTGSQAL
jgi:hypothetical protein